MSTYTIHVRYDDDPAEVEQFAGTPAELVAWAQGEADPEARYTIERDYTPILGGRIDGRGRFDWSVPAEDWRGPLSANLHARSDGSLVAVVNQSKTRTTRTYPTTLWCSTCGGVDLSTAVGGSTRCANCGTIVATVVA